jgi:dextranase
VTELLPTKATFGVDELVEVEVRGAAGQSRLSLWRLHEKLAEVVVEAGTSTAVFGVLEAGGYGVEADDGARTALDVQGTPLQRLRYGFVSDYAPARSMSGVMDNVRRLHLNIVQFYDWMYRHAELLPPDDVFEDALGRVVSLETVRALTAAVREVGSLPLGYAAVYAVGRETRDEWVEELLYRAGGSPWMLADFLWIVDPSSRRWLDHLTEELVAASRGAGFAGFHLDQYGAPKQAARSDGTIVDLAAAFPALIERVRAAMPDATLVFNNVNDFPTWATARAPQDAVYIEVWPPHERLDHLGELVARARALAPEKPVALAAYLSSYARDDETARAAMCLELATVFSHGATCLLHGEEDAILVDPYYVRHEHMDAAAVAAARDYYDFAVRYGDLLFDRDSVDVTRVYLGGVNTEIRVHGSAPVATDCLPGTVWARAIKCRQRVVVSLIDLSVQTEVLWDARKVSGGSVGGLTVSFERVGASATRIFTASPGAPTAWELESTLEEGYDVVRVPDWATWSLVWAEAAG